jgi:hypothetical protein
MPTGRPDAFPFEWVVDWYRSVIDAKVKKKKLNSHPKLRPLSVYGWHTSLSRITQGIVLFESVPGETVRQPRLRVKENPIKNCNHD